MCRLKRQKAIMQSIAMAVVAQGPRHAESLFFGRNLESQEHQEHLSQTENHIGGILHGRRSHCPMLLTMKMKPETVYMVTARRKTTDPVLKHPAFTLVTMWNVFATLREPLRPHREIQAKLSTKIKQALLKLASLIGPNIRCCKINIII